MTREQPRRIEWIVVAFAGIVLLAIAFRQPMSERLYPEAKTTQLLDAAALALHEGKLSSVDGTGARELYNAALAMDPDRDEARIGLRQVGEAALSEAAKATLERRYADAHRALRLARELSVPRARADAVAESLRQQESQVTGIDRLLAQAEDARTVGNLDGGEQSALPLYRRVLQLQPANNVALEGREDALSDLLQQAQAKLGERDYAAASALVARVREYDAGHVGLPEATAALTQARDRELARGDTALRRRALGDAAAAYKVVLALDPADEAARDGLTRTVQAWTARSEREASDFRFDEAEKSLQRAREVAAGMPVDPASSTTTAAPSVPPAMSSALASAERRIATARARETRLPAVRVSPAMRSEIQRLLDLATAAAARGDLLTPPGESAYDRVQRARSLAPADPDVLRAQARLLPAAQRCFDAALRGNDLVQARGCLDARAQLGDSAASVLQAKNRLATRWIAVGEERLRGGDVTGAQRALNTARDLDPGAAGLDAFAERTRAAMRAADARR